MRNLLVAGATIAALALNMGALAADATKDKEKKPEAKPAPTASVPAVQKTATPAAAKKPPDPAAEKGIILQKPADKSAPAAPAASAQKVKPTDSSLKQSPTKSVPAVQKTSTPAAAKKPPDPAAEKGIILQKPADKSAPAAPASPALKQKTTGG